MDSQQKRRIFFWVLAILFATTASLVIFYALGYRFNFEKGVFVYGGSITIKSNPRSVSIELDNKPVSRKKINYINNSYHIDGIRPGDYELRVSAPGFKSWIKKIRVRSGISTEFWNILLAREDYTIQNWHVTGQERFFSSPDGRYIAYPQNSSDAFIINLIDTRSGLHESVFSTSEYAFMSDPREKIEWSSQSGAFFVPASRKTDQEKKHIIFFLEDQKIALIEEMVQKNLITQARWDPENKNIIYFMSENNLFRLDLKNENAVKKIAENIISFDFASNKIYFMQSSGLVYAIERDGSEKPQQVTKSPPDDMDGNTYQIIVYDKDRIAFLNNQKAKLHIWNMSEKANYFRELASNVRDVQFSDDGKKLLYWSDWEIFVYFTRDWNVQPKRAENEILNITRLSQTIKNTQWAKNYEHVLFVSANTLKVIELDRRDRLNTMDIYNFKTASGFVASHPTKEKIYFTEKVDDNSFGFYSLDFPEKEGILGL